MAQAYNYSNFVYADAVDGQLCAIVGPKSETESTLEVKGTGTAVQKSKGMTIVVEGVTYVFNSSGNPISQNAKDAKYTLKMAESNLTGITAGSSGITRNVIERSINEETNEIEYSAPVEDDDDHSVTINTLNARDQFAVRALSEMMSKLDDPSAVSKNEITHYCEAAYKWASYMVEQSSYARALVKDAESTPTTVEEEVIPETTQEKLINNIVAAIKKTTVESSGTLESENSQRVSIPKLIEFLNAYVADGQNTVGLKDLISAINSISIDTSNDSIRKDYYTSTTEAESDGWSYSGGTWSKTGYSSVTGDHDAETAATLPTGRIVQKVSITEMPALIEALNNIADAIRNS